jgi:hypothetical protein
MLPSFFLPNSAAPVALSASTPEVAFAIGQANIVTKVGSGDLITAAIGQANIVTHVNLEGSGPLPI